VPDINQQKIEANSLRKKGQIQEALPLYRELWGKTRDEFDGAGLIHCLRKMELFDEAIVLADEMLKKYPDFDWGRNESIWAYIQGALSVLGEETPIQTLVDKANHIMSLNPKGLAAKAVVFKVLKLAKSSNHWGVVNGWVTKIDPSSLGVSPTTTDSGREGWSEQSQWYNYRIRGIIEEYDSKYELEEALSLAGQAIQLFPKQSKFFLRLKALAYSHLGSYRESAEIYKNLCSRPNPDWWLLHEYAKIHQAQGHEEEALMLMYQAASNHHKLESMVNLFSDIGMLCHKLKKYREARAHLALCKYVREDRGWGIPEQITPTINSINQQFNDSEPSSQKEAYDICQSEWRTKLHKEGFKHGTVEERKARRGLIGRIISITDDRPFCFIITKDRDSFFCSKSELPATINNGNEVSFDAIPSYDKKKQQDSWRAVNIKHIKNNSTD
jgi:tetratricopeptide (TPR) repeat protein